MTVDPCAMTLQILQASAHHKFCPQRKTQGTRLSQSAKISQRAAALIAGENCSRHFNIDITPHSHRTVSLPVLMSDAGRLE